MTLCFYLSLNYVCNNVEQGAKKISQPIQTKIKTDSNLFSR